MTAPSGPARRPRGDEHQARLTDLHATLVEQIATLTEADQWRAWLTFTARFHTYSFNNTILIWLQRPDATWIAGIKRWNAMGRRVRKGERGIAILAPITARATTTDPDPVTEPPDPPDPPGPAGVAAVTGAAVTGPGEKALASLDGAVGSGPGRALRGVKIVHVFDISQTEGDPIEPPNRPGHSDVDTVLLTGQAPPGVWDALVGIANEHGYRVERGFCDGANGSIAFTDRLIQVRADVADAQAVKTLAHELGHLLLHDPDDFQGGVTAACRGEKEVEAESVAFLTAAHTGLDTSDYTFGYVTVWAERAVAQTGQPPHEIVRACGSRVVRAAARLATGLDRALGHGEPPAAATLAARVAAGVQTAAQTRATAQAIAAAAQAGRFDTPPGAGRAFQPLPPQPRPATPAPASPTSGPASPTSGPASPTAGRTRHR